MISPERFLCAARILQIGMRHSPFRAGSDAMRAIGAGGEQQAMKSALIRPIAILAVAGMAMLAFAQQKKPAAFYTEEALPMFVY